MLYFARDSRAEERWPRFTAIAAALSALVMSPGTWAGEAFEPFLWNYRIIVVDAGGGDESVASLLHDARTDIDARQVLWFLLGDQGVTTNFEGQLPDAFEQDVRHSYLLKHTVRAVLIGKDGGVKKRASRFDLHEMLALIDTMPMRRREMQEQKR